MPKTLFQNNQLMLLWPPYVTGQAIIFSSCGFFFLSFSFFPRLISAVADWMSTTAYFYTWCGPSANLECRSKMCCTPLAGNAGRKKSQKNHTKDTPCMEVW